VSESGVGDVERLVGDVERLEQARLDYERTVSAPRHHPLARQSLLFMRQHGKAVLSVAIPLSLAAKIVAVAHGDQSKAASIATESDKAKIVFGLGVQLLPPLLLLIGSLLADEVLARSLKRALLREVRSSSIRDVPLLDLVFALALLLLMLLGVRLLIWPYEVLLLVFGGYVICFYPFARLLLWTLRRRRRKKSRSISNTAAYPAAGPKKASILADPKKLYNFSTIGFLLTFFISCYGALDDTPWLPPNNVTVQGKTYVAYVLYEEFGNVTLLRDSDRNVLYFKEEDVGGRTVCTRSSRATTRSIEEIWFKHIREMRPHCA